MSLFERALPVLRTVRRKYPQQTQQILLMERRLSAASRLKQVPHIIWTLAPAGVRRGWDGNLPNTVRLTSSLQVCTQVPAREGRVQVLQTRMLSKCIPHTLSQEGHLVASQHRGGSAGAVSRHEALGAWSCGGLKEACKILQRC